MIAVLYIGLLSLLFVFVVISFIEYPNFVCTKPVLVKFKDGKYGVMKKLYNIYPIYACDSHWWNDSKCINKYCKFDSKERAIEIFEMIQNPEYTIENDLGE